MSNEKKLQGTMKFSKEEKLSILAEAKTHGVQDNLAKYGLYPTTFYYWKKELRQHGVCQ